MDEYIEVSARAAPGLPSSRTPALSSRRTVACRSGTRIAMWCRPGPAFLEKLRDRGTRVERFEQLDARCARRAASRRSLFRAPRFRATRPASRVRRVEGQRFVERTHRDAEMIDLPMLSLRIAHACAGGVSRSVEQFGNACAVDRDGLEYRRDRFPHAPETASPRSRAASAPRPADPPC